MTLFHVFRQVEVKQHRPAIVGQQHIGGFEIAMQDAAPVGMAEAIR